MATILDTKGSTSGCIYAPSDRDIDMKLYIVQLHTTQCTQEPFKKGFPVCGHLIRREDWTQFRSKRRWMSEYISCLRNIACSADFPATKIHGMYISSMYVHYLDGFAQLFACLAKYRKVERAWGFLLSTAYFDVHVFISTVSTVRCYPSTKVFSWA